VNDGSLGPVVLVVALVLAASQIRWLWFTVKFFRPETLPSLPPAEVLNARRRAITSRLMRLGSYAAVGAILLVGPRGLVPLAVVALGLSMASMLHRPSRMLTDARLKELSQQSRAAHLAARVAKVTDQKK